MGVTVKDTSLLRHKVNEAWLPSVAPQEDGAPPLIWGYTSVRAEFTIALPYGTEATSFPDDEFLKDDVEMQALLKLDQPLRAIKISMPARLKNERLETYASRVRNELERSKAVFYPEQEPVNLSDYRFVRLEYHRFHDGAEIAHCVFFGPLGPRVLAIDMLCAPEQRERCRPYFEKIIRSFRAGWKCRRAMLMEDPGYGDYANSGLLQESSE